MAEFVGRNVEGHLIAGRAEGEHETSTLTLFCECGEWAHSVGTGTNVLVALQTLADAGLAHIVSVMRERDE